MEPNDPSKRLEDMMNKWKNINYSFTVPVGTYRFNLPTETVDETLARLDETDAVVEAMTSYPTAERMLNELLTKNK